MQMTVSCSIAFIVPTINLSPLDGLKFCTVLYLCVLCYISLSWLFPPFYKPFLPSNSMMMPFFFFLYSLHRQLSLFLEFSFFQSLNAFPSTYADSFQTPPPQEIVRYNASIIAPALPSVTIYSLILSSKSQDQLSHMLVCVHMSVCVWACAHVDAQSRLCLSLLLNCKLCKDKAICGHIFDV